MAKFVSITVGFITNSSSVVHHFPRALLEQPEIKAFLEAFEIQDGFVGSEIWNRSSCGSFAVTKEQKAQILAELNHSDYGGGYNVDVDGDSVVVVYGDEYSDIASILHHMLWQTATSLGIAAGESFDYN